MSKDLSDLMAMNTAQLMAEKKDLEDARNAINAKLQQLHAVLNVKVAFQVQDIAVAVSVSDVVVDEVVTP